MMNCVGDIKPQNCLEFVDIYTWLVVKILINNCHVYVYEKCCMPKTKWSYYWKLSFKLTGWLSKWFVHEDI